MEPIGAVRRWSGVIARHPAASDPAPDRSPSEGADHLRSDPDVPLTIPVDAATLDAVTPSFEAFYLGTRSDLGRAIALAIGDADLAAEATDEAYTRACARWASIRTGNPEGWVYRVAVNWALSVLRQRRRSPHRLYQPEAHDPGVADPSISAALAELDAKQRAVVVCRHLLGWSVADTAAALRIREGTVKSRLSRANRVLAARLAHLRPDQEQP